MCALIKSPCYLGSESEGRHLCCLSKLSPIGCGGTIEPAPLLNLNPLFRQNNNQLLKLELGIPNELVTLCRCLDLCCVFLTVRCFSVLCVSKYSMSLSVVNIGCFSLLFVSQCYVTIGDTSLALVICFFVCFSVVCSSAQCCVLLCTMLWLSTNQVCQPRPDGFPANWSLPILSQPPAMSMSPPENALYTFLTLCSTIYITHTILHIAQQYTYHTVTHHTAAQYT